MAAVATRIRQEALVPYYVAAPAPKAARDGSQAPPAPAARGRKRGRSSEGVSSSQKLERCRTQAQQRRMTQKGLMEELASLLPFPREVTSQMDTKTVLRLAVCYLRVKSLLSDGDPPSPPVDADSAVVVANGDPARWPGDTPGSSLWKKTTISSSSSSLEKTAEGNRLWAEVGKYDTAVSAFGLGALQDLMIEALQGFLMVISCDGTILYLSDSVFTHTGLFQSENTGRSLYNLVHEEDHGEVRDALTTAEAAALSSGEASCSFFCRMKSKKKNSHLKAPGHKLVYVSGHCKAHQLETYVACTVHIVSAPSVLEIRVEGNAFTTRHSLEMKVIFYDERLQDVMGYTKKDLLGQSLFSLHHHDDLPITMKCSKSVREKGEVVTGYYRLLTNFGTYVWVQSRGTMVMDRRTGKPSQFVCMHFIVEKEKGEESLKLRNLLTADSSHIKPSTGISMDPVPVPREDGECVNPLSPTSPTGSISPPPSIYSQQSDAPVIKLSSPATSFSHSQSGMVSRPIPIPSSGHRQLLPPLSTPSTPSSIPQSTPPLSNYSTPIVSPHCSEETSPFSCSHSSNPHSIPGSATASPHSVPAHESVPDHTSLEDILQELMGPSTTSDPPPPPPPPPPPLSSYDPRPLAISPESSCTDLEDYLLTLANDSPRSSLVCTPARSPASSSNPPSVAPSPSVIINPSSTTPSPLGSYINPSSTTHSPLGGYVNPSSTTPSPLQGYVNPSSTTPSPPGPHSTMPAGTTLSSQGYYFNPFGTAPVNPSSTHTLRGLLSEQGQLLS